MCRNHKHSYTLTTDNGEPNHEQTAFYNYYKENKIPRNKTSKGYKRPLQGELQTTTQGNDRTQKKWKNI